MKNDHDLDTVERLSQNLYHATPRRGFLSTVGKVLLGLVGVTVLDALPLDRTTKVALAKPGENHTNPLSCQYWKYCSVNTGGWSPCPCCSQISSDCVCPYGTLPGSNYWIGCCTNPSGVRRILRYYDCSVSLPGQVQCNFTDCSIQCHNDNNANGANPHTSGGVGSYYHQIVWGPNGNVICTAVCTSSTSC